MGLFWLGVSLGYMSKVGPWEYFTWMLGMGIGAVYYDAYRRKIAEAVCDREEFGLELHKQKLFMVQDVWLQEPAIKKETH